MADDLTRLLHKKLNMIAGHRGWDGPPSLRFNLARGIIDDVHYIQRDLRVFLYVYLDDYHAWG